MSEHEEYIRSIVEEEGTHAWVHWSISEIDTLRRQLAEAEANVAQLETFLDIQPRTPAAALAEYRREVLEEVAKLVDGKAAECRCNSECAYQEGHPIAGTNYRVRAVSMESIAAEIRAMGEKA